MTLTANPVLDLCLIYVTCVQNLCVHRSYLPRFQVFLVSLQHRDFAGLQTDPSRSGTGTPVAAQEFFAESNLQSLPQRFLPYSTLGAVGTQEPKSSILCHAVPLQYAHTLCPLFEIY